MVKRVMHELGIVIQIIKQLDDYVIEHNIDEVEAIVLEIGALSGVYPKYIEDVYPIAVENTRFKGTRLEIEVAPGLGRCNCCGFGYDLIANKNICPRCEKEQFSVISGREFLIKQLIVREH